MPDAEELARVFLEQGPGCGWIWYPDGTFAAVFKDPGPVLGSSGEFQGRKLAECLDPAEAARWEGWLARACQGESLAVRERIGTSTWNFWIFPIRIAGEIRFVGCQASEVAQSGNANQQLRHTVVETVRVQRQERKRMSRFLHDSIGQNMTALGLQLDLLRMDLENIVPEVCARIADLQQHALEPMMAEVREFTHTLNPSYVERAGLPFALERLAARPRPDFAGIVRAHVDKAFRMPPKTAVAAYWIAEEALENAIRHAKCSMIEISVRSTQTGAVLEIRDNGTGFAPGDLVNGNRGLGLPGMEHYAAEAGMAFSIESRLGAGTTVRAETSFTAEA